MVGLRKPDSSRYTWTDYCRWNDDQRWEIVGGEAFAMTPAPTPRHQQVVGNLYRRTFEHFEEKTCIPLISPIDLKLSDKDVVQPDLLVVCDPKQIRSTHIEGAPSLIVEVLLPSTALHDRGRKLELYARYGVGEVWLVTPSPSAIEVFLLDGDSYRLNRTYAKEDALRSPTFPDREIALADVFNFPVDPGEQIPLVREGRPPAYASST